LDGSAEAVRVKSEIQILPKPKVVLFPLFDHSSGIEIKTLYPPWTKNLKKTSKNIYRPLREEKKAVKQSFDAGRPEKKQTTSEQLSKKEGFTKFSSKHLSHRKVF